MLVLIYVAGHNEHMMNALLALGKSQLRSGDVKSSLKSFSRLLAIAKKIPDPEGICNAHLMLSFAYKLRAIIRESLLSKTKYISITSLKIKADEI